MLVQGETERGRNRPGAAVRFALTIACLAAVGLFTSASAQAKNPPPHAFASVNSTECFVKETAFGTSIGAKVSATIGANAKKHNALRRFEVKYRLVHADTTPGLPWSKPGYKVAASKTAKYSDKKGYTYKPRGLSTNLEPIGSDTTSRSSSFVCAGIRPNWKLKNQLYTLNESNWQAAGPEHAGRSPQRVDESSTAGRDATRGWTRAIGRTCCRADGGHIHPRLPAASSAQSYGSWTGTVTLDDRVTSGGETPFGGTTRDRRMVASATITGADAPADPGFNLYLLNGTVDATLSEMSAYTNGENAGRCDLTAHSFPSSTAGIRST